MFDAWKLFWSMFSEGDNVVVITEDDEFYWGKMSTTDTCCCLTGHGGMTEIDWDDVVLIAHDGFPVRKVFGEGSVVEQLDTSNVEDAIRCALSSVRCRYCGRWIKHDLAPHKCIKKAISSSDDDGEGVTIARGDPWLIENVRAEIVNPGVFWMEDNWQYEETLRLYAPDGARGLLWRLDTIFYARIGAMEIEA
jgi:hypothetical protein